MKSEFNIGTLLVLFPVLHLVSVSIMLYFYCSAFGGNLFAFLRPGDIFAISMQWLVVMYFASIAIPAITTMVRYRSGTPFASDKIARIENEEERVREYAKLERGRGLFTLSSIIMLGMGVGGVLLQMWRGDAPSMLLIYLSSIPVVGIILNKIKLPLGISDFPHEVMLIGVPFLIAASCLGHDYGQMDKDALYIDRLKTTARCDDGLILKSFGENYLVVLPDDTKALMDKSCKAIIFFPDSARIERVLPRN